MRAIDQDFHMAQAVLFPGQGAQFRGMGRELFKKFPGLVGCASEILGYSIEHLCVEDPDNQLTKTQFTQPALYVVNALAYYDRRESKAFLAVDYLAGHSLGEYNALLAAEVFSFEEGLELVKLRGQLMGEVTGGGMAAVLGVSALEVSRVLQQSHLPGVELANFNTPTQSVISGPAKDIATAEQAFLKVGIRFVVLNVGAAFHSRSMQAAQEVFRSKLNKTQLRNPKIPVIANVTARPYENDRVAETLGSQIASPVKWMESVIFLLAQGDVRYTEIGGSILTKMSDEIQKICTSEIRSMKATLEGQSTVRKPSATPDKYFQTW